MPEPNRGQEHPEIGSPDWLERYSRQTLLKGVGVEGQKKWAQATLRVIGEGEALEACLTALASSGAGNLRIVTTPGKANNFYRGDAKKDVVLEEGQNRKIFDIKSFSIDHPQTQVDLLSELSTPSNADLTVVVTGDAELRRQTSRQLRSQKKVGVFAWPAASGFALWVGPHAEGKCPCLECFEVLNPKAFNKGTPVIQRLLGQAAASEALLYLLNGNSPLANKVWMNAFDVGVSLHHEVHPSYKCPAQLEDEGATVTP